MGFKKVNPPLDLLESVVNFQLSYIGQQQVDSDRFGQFFVLLVQPLLQCIFFFQIYINDLYIGLHIQVHFGWLVVFRYICAI